MLSKHSWYCCQLSPRVYWMQIHWHSSLAVYMKTQTALVMHVCAYSLGFPAQAFDYRVQGSHRQVIFSIPGGTSPNRSPICAMAYKLGLVQGPGRSTNKFEWSQRGHFLITHRNFRLVMLMKTNRGVGGSGLKAGCQQHLTCSVLCLYLSDRHPRDQDSVWGGHTGYQRHKESALHLHEQSWTAAGKGKCQWQTIQLLITTTRGWV